MTHAHQRNGIGRTQGNISHLLVKTTFPHEERKRWQNIKDVKVTVVNVTVATIRQQLNIYVHGDFAELDFHSVN